MITQTPDPILSEECTMTNHKSGVEIGRKLKQAYEEYQRAHPDVRVVGMSAPQIGIAKKVFYAFGEVFINPFIQKLSGSQLCIEGCCSIPDAQYETKRHHSITLGWLQPSRSLRYSTFEGHQACIIQHELDHLEGVLISDHGILQKWILTEQSV